MASIGIIVRSDQALTELPASWIPPPLGTRQHVISVLEECLSGFPDNLGMRFQLEEESESDDPRSITVSGVYGPNELAVIRMVCRAFDARLFDAETADFLEI